MEELRQNFVQLYIFILGNVFITVYDILSMAYFRRIVTVTNHKRLQKIGIATHILANLFGIWGLTLGINPKWNQIFEYGTLDQKRHWRYMSMLASLMIWTRVIVVLWYILIILSACVCLTLCLIFSLLSVPRAMSRRSNSSMLGA